MVWSRKVGSVCKASSFYAHGSGEALRLPDYSEGESVKYVVKSNTWFGVGHWGRAGRKAHAIGVTIGIHWGFRLILRGRR